AVVVAGEPSSEAAARGAHRAPGARRQAGLLRRRRRAYQRDARGHARTRRGARDRVVGGELMSADHQHAHAHDHDHGHAHGAHGHHHHHAPVAGHGRAFALAVALNLVIVVAQGVYGVIAHSAALLADAGHNLSDVLGLLLAWGATWLATRRPSARFTFGFG